MRTAGRLLFGLFLLLTPLYSSAQVDPVTVPGHVGSFDSTVGVSLDGAGKMVSWVSLDGTKLVDGTDYNFWQSGVTPAYAPPWAEAQTGICGTALRGDGVAGGHAHVTGWPNSGDTFSVWGITGAYTFIWVGAAVSVDTSYCSTVTSPPTGGADQCFRNPYLVGDERGSFGFYFADRAGLPTLGVFMGDDVNVAATEQSITLGAPLMVAARFAGAPGDLIELEINGTASTTTSVTGFRNFDARLMLFGGGLEERWSDAWLRYLVIFNRRLSDQELADVKLWLEGQTCFTGGAPPPPVPRPLEVILDDQQAELDAFVSAMQALIDEARIHE